LVKKEDKERVVAELTERLRTTETLLVADYRGLTMPQIDELRSKLIEHGARFAVVKNTLTRRAATDAGLGNVVELLHGPTAVAFMKGDAVQGAKALLELARRYPALVIKGALIEGRVLGEDDARSLATIDTKEVSAAKVAGTILTSSKPPTTAYRPTPSRPPAASADGTATAIPSP